MKPASQAFRSTQERAPRLYDGSVCTLGSVRMKFVNDILCYFRPDERLKHKRRKQRKNSTKPGLYRFFLFLIQRSMEWRWRWLKISYCQNALKEEQMKTKRTHAQPNKQKKNTKKQGWLALRISPSRSWSGGSLGISHSSRLWIWDQRSHSSTCTLWYIYLSDRVSLRLWDANFGKLRTENNWTTPIANSNVWLLFECFVANSHFNRKLRH